MRAFIASLLTLATVAMASAHGLHFGAPPPVNYVGPIASMSFGSGFRYLDNYANGYYTMGDTFYNTWGDDGKIYATCNDCSVPQTTSANQNIMLNTLSSYIPALITNGGPTIVVSTGNALVNWGHTSDGATDGLSANWKSGGLMCQGSPGKLYYLVHRNTGSPNYYFSNASVTVSTDKGTSWNPVPSGNQPFATPMFPGTNIPNGWFQYGQCYTGAGPDGSSTYFYALVNEAGAQTAAGERQWLSRVPIASVLTASAWQYYIGPAGGDGSNAANWCNTLEITTASVCSSIATVMFGAGPASGPWLAYSTCCGPSVTYLPRYQEYVAFGYNQWTGSGCGNTYPAILTAWASPRPWGPYRIVGQFTACSGEGWSGVLMASIQGGGKSFTLLSSGDYSTYPTYGPSSPNNYYTAYLRPVTVSP